MIKLYQKIFLDLLFPKNCLICEAPGKHICARCLQSIPLQKENFCPICEEIETFAGRVCNTCENNHSKIYLDGLLVASYYKHPILKELIHRYKYSFIQDLSDDLAQILKRKLLSSPEFPWPNFIFSAVPLHLNRLRWRGFNQSTLMIKKLKNQLANDGIKIKYLPELIIRHRDTPPQMKAKSIELRKQNISGSFSINKELPKKLPKKIILVDDVITTGATLEECAKVLKKTGQVKKVWGLVLGRQN